MLFQMSRPWNKRLKVWQYRDNSCGVILCTDISGVKRLAEVLKTSNRGNTVVLDTHKIS